MDQSTVAGWLLLALLAGFLYNKWKGRSFWVAFIASTLLTPVVAFLLILLSSKNEDVLEQRKVNRGKRKRCPQCAEVVKVEANVCKHCGAEF